MGSQDHSITSRRAALAGAAWLLSGCASGEAESAGRVDVLFVCQYGTVKSAIAREHFRRMAAARAQNFRAQSRGISPEQHVSPRLAADLAAEGLDIRAEPIRTLSAEDLVAADVIVVFDALPAQFGSWPVRDWSDLPSMNADYSAARGILLVRLGALLEELAS
jgi:hypothetical protein